MWQCCTFLLFTIVSYFVIYKVLRIIYTRSSCSRLDKLTFYLHHERDVNFENCLVKDMFKTYLKKCLSVNKNTHKKNKNTIRILLIQILQETLKYRFNLFCNKSLKIVH